MTSAKAIGKVHVSPASSLAWPEALSLSVSPDALPPKLNCGRSTSPVEMKKLKPVAGIQPATCCLRTNPIKNVEHVPCFFSVIVNSGWIFFKFYGMIIKFIFKIVI